MFTHFNGRRNIKTGMISHRQTLEPGLLIESPMNYLRCPALTITIFPKENSKNEYMTFTSNMGAFFSTE
jgi:hypothetical protein